MTLLEDEHGPFDIIGDVHGCIDELLRLLTRLGYDVSPSRSPDARAAHPQTRRVIFLGDLVNRGPDTPGVLRLVMAMVASGQALCVAGNHDVLLQRRLQGQPAGNYESFLTESLAQLEGAPESFLREVTAFIEALPRYLILDEGRLVLAHAGLPEAYHGETSEEALDFAVNGRRTGELDENGNQVRYRWWEEYRGSPLVVYGHYAQERANWLDASVCIDTGCVYGGRLTALRYPERELVSVLAAKVYKETKRSPSIRAAALAGA